MRKSEVLSFSTTLPPASALARELGRHPLAQAARDLAQLARAEPVSLPEGRLGRDALDRAVGRHRAVVLAVRELREPPAELAEARRQLLLAQRLQVGDGRSPLASMRRAVTAPTPWILRTDSGARNAFASARPMTEKPRGFCSSEASLARNLLADSPIETVMPTSRSMRRGDQRQRLRPPAAPRCDSSSVRSR